MMAAKQWHFSNWSPLGWLETVIKLVAQVAAIIALVNALSSGTFSSPSGVRLVQVVVMAILALLLTFAIVDRYMEREIFAMIFVLINNIAHWGMVYALLTTPGPGSLLLIFTALMALGDLIKVRWLIVSKFSVRGTSTKVMVGLASTFVIGYLIVLLLALVS